MKINTLSFKNLKRCVLATFVLTISVLLLFSNIADAVIGAYFGNNLSKPNINILRAGKIDNNNHINPYIPQGKISRIEDKEQKLENDKPFIVELTVLALLALLLSACAAPETSSPAETEIQPTSTPVPPISTPVVQPTSTPVPEPTQNRQTLADKLQPFTEDMDPVVKEMVDTFRDGKEDFLTGNFIAGTTSPPLKPYDRNELPDNLFTKEGKIIKKQILNLLSKEETIYLFYSKFAESPELLFNVEVMNACLKLADMAESQEQRKQIHEFIKSLLVKESFHFKTRQENNPKDVQFSRLLIVINNIHIMDDNKFYPDKFNFSPQNYYILAKTLTSLMVDTETSGFETQTDYLRTHGLNSQSFTDMKQLVNKKQEEGVFTPEMANRLKEVFSEYQKILEIHDRNTLKEYVAKQLSLIDRPDYQYIADAFIADLYQGNIVEVVARDGSSHFEFTPDSFIHQEKYFNPENEEFLGNKIPVTPLRVPEDYYTD